MAETSAADGAGDMIDDFAAMLSGMARLLDRISALDAFTSSGLHVAEWLALSVIATNEGLGNNGIAKKLGVSGQRTQQICEILLKQGFIAVERSNEDGRRKTIKMRSEGTAMLGSIRANLTDQLEQDLGERTVLIERVSRYMRTMRRIGAPLKVAEAPT